MTQMFKTALRRLNQYLTFTRTAIELRRLPLAVRIDLDIAGIEDKVAARAVYGR